jgi:DNA-binding NarL/FixJ family response regulator
MTKRPAYGGEAGRAVVIRIADASLADRVAAMLADEVDLVALDASDDADVMITDHLPVDAQIPTIVLADHPNGLAALQAGAGGAIPRSCTASDLVLAIEAAARGFAMISRDAIAPRQADTSPDTAAAERAIAQGVNRLTGRELEVLRLLAEGASNKLIARRLGISIHTAKFHVASIAAKLDATGRTDAVMQAVRLGLML